MLRIFMEHLSLNVYNDVLMKLYSKPYKRIANNLQAYIETNNILGKILSIMLHALLYF